VPGYLPGEARTWMPHLTPYDPKVALEQRGLATTELGIGAPDVTQRAQYKMAGGIPLNQAEQDAAAGAAQRMQKLGGPGTVVKLDIPGMTTTVGSPYNLTAMGNREYATPGEAAANALPGEHVVQTNRGTFMPIAPRAPTATEGYPQAPGAPAITAGGTSGAAAPGTNQAQPGTSTVTPPPGAPGAAPRPGTAGGAAARPAARVPQPAAPQSATSSVAPAGEPAAATPPPPPPPPPAAPAPAAPAAPAPPPAGVAAPTPPALPAPPPAYMPPGIDPNAVAPARPVPAAPPPRVGFPSPAPAEAKPDLQTQIPTVQPSAPPTRIVAPPVQPTPPPQGPSTIKTDPVTGVPLQKVTRKYQSGEEETFGATPIRNPEVRLRLREVGITNPDTASPAQIAAYEQDELSDTQRLEIAKTDIQRLRRGQSESEQTATQTLMDYRNNLNKFLEDFPNAGDRDIYIGWINRPVREFLEHFRQDPKFQAFVADLAPFQERFFERAGSALTTHEIAVLAPTLPTGGEVDPAAFEARLQRFNDRVNDRLSLRLVTQNMPVEEITPDFANKYLQGLAEQRATRRLAIATQGEAPPPEAPPSTVVINPPPPTSTTLPPAGPAAAAPPPFQVYGDWAQ
jgi:hypothetical protein